MGKNPLKTHGIIFMTFPWGISIRVRGAVTVGFLIWHRLVILFFKNNKAIIFVAKHVVSIGLSDSSRTVVLYPRRYQCYREQTACHTGLRESRADLQWVTQMRFSSKMREMLTDLWEFRQSLAMARDSISVKSPDVSSQLEISHVVVVPCRLNSLSWAVLTVQPLYQM